MPKFDNRLDRLGDALQRAAAADLDAAASAEAQAAAPFWRRRGPRLGLSGAVALTVAAAALIVSAGGDNTSSAYAVETQPGGGTKIEIFSLDESEGVEQALEEAGIASQVTQLEAGMACREPHYQPSMAMLRTLEASQPQPQPWAGFNYESKDGPLTIAIGDYQQRQEMDEEIREAVRQGDLSGGGSPSFVVDPTGLRADQTLIITNSPIPEQVGTVGQVRVAEGEVDPCEPVPAAEARRR